MYVQIHNQYASAVERISIPLSPTGWGSDTDVAEWLRAYHEDTEPGFELESVAGAIIDGSAPANTVAYLRSKRRCEGGCGMHLVFVLEKRHDSRRDNSCPEYQAWSRRYNQPTPRCHQVIVARPALPYEHEYYSKRLARVTAIVAGYVTVTETCEEEVFESFETEQIQNYCLAEKWLAAYSQRPNGLHKPLTVSQVFAQCPEDHEWWVEEGQYFSPRDSDEELDNVYPVATLTDGGKAYLLVREHWGNTSQGVRVLDLPHDNPFAWASRKGYVSSDV